MSTVTVELVLADGRSWTLRTGQSFLIGRSPKNTVHLTGDGLVSRRHAVIELRRGGLYLTDLGSQNGTFVDGERLTPHVATPVHAARKVQIGEHVLSLRASGAFDDDEVETQARRKLPLPEDEFALLGKIADGLTGVVYAAEQILLRRKVAIKVLRSELARDEPTRQRFLRQAWLAAQIQSPYVVEVYDVRTEREQACLVMELVQGPSARDRLRAGPLPPAEVLRIGEDIARALQAAAEAGVVHRSISPSAILLHPSGIAKLSDFGNAKAIVTSTGEATPLRQLFGTTAYAAPELARAAEATLAVDVYGLGATLHHLLCGGEESPADDGLSPLSRCPLPASLPTELEQLIEAMLRDDPAERPRVDSLPDLFRSVRLRHYRPDRASSQAMVSETTHRRRPRDPAED